MTRVAICIATCRRPAGLAALLAALDALEFHDAPPEIGVVVIDNDPAGGARATCDRLRDAIRLPLRYVHEPRTGIAIARNRALDEAADVDWIAFVDDDEVPTPRWLDALLRMQRRHDADVVAGPVLPRFDAPPPAWLLEGRFFEPVRRFAGARLGSAYTGNLLLRPGVVRALGRGFDERMAPIGEDRELLERVAASGARMVWCPDAVAFERVPEARARIGWIVRRGYQTGVAATRIARLRGSLRRAAPRALAHGLYCIARGLAGAAAGGLRGGAAAIAGLRLAGFGLGRLAGLARAA